MPLGSIFPRFQDSFLHFPTDPIHTDIRYPNSLSSPWRPRRKMRFLLTWKVSNDHIHTQIAPKKKELHNASTTPSLAKFQKMDPTTATYVSHNIPVTRSILTRLQQVGWIATVALMTKTQIGLGVLSIPQTFDALGLIPGILCLIAVATITTWSDYMIGVFKKRHPQVYGIDDAGYLLFGRIGREFLATVFMLCEQSASLLLYFH